MMEGKSVGSASSKSVPPIAQPRENKEFKVEGGKKKIGGWKETQSQGKT